MSVTGTVQTVGFSPTSTPTPPSESNAVLYVPQALTAVQKLQALINIGALTNSDVNTLISNANYNVNTRIITFTRKDSTTFSFDLSQNIGVDDVELDLNQDLVISYLNGSSKIIPLSSLLSGFVTSVNGIVGSTVVIGIDDIDDLRLELNSRLPTGTTITIDGVTKNLQSNPVFTRTPKNKGLFEHILTAGDIANPIMTFQLPHTPIMDEWEFLYVGAGIVSPVSYSVTGDILTINTATFTYPVQAGRRLLYRYMY